MWIIKSDLLVLPGADNTQSSYQRDLIKDIAHSCIRVSSQGILCSVHSIRWDSVKKGTLKDTVMETHCHYRGE